MFHFRYILITIILSTLLSTLSTGQSLFYLNGQAVTTPKYQAIQLEAHVLPVNFFGFYGGVGYEHSPTAASIEAGYDELIHPHRATASLGIRLSYSTRMDEYNAKHYFSITANAGGKLFSGDQYRFFREDLRLSVQGGMQLPLYAGQLIPYSFIQMDITTPSLFTYGIGVRFIPDSFVDTSGGNLQCY